MRIFIAFFLSLLALSWRISFSDVFSIGNISFNPLILLLYFTTFYWNGWYGLFLGFLLGLLYGIFFPVPFGFYSLVFCSLSFGFLAVRRRIYKYKYTSLIILFIATFIFGVIELLVQGLSTGLFMLYLGINVIPKSILTTIIGIGILYILKKMQCGLHLNY